MWTHTHPLQLDWSQTSSSDSYQLRLLSQLLFSHLPRTDGSAALLCCTLFLFSQIGTLCFDFTQQKLKSFHLSSLLGYSEQPAAGRRQFRGCELPLWSLPLTQLLPELWSGEPQPGHEPLLLSLHNSHIFLGWMGRWQGGRIYSCVVTFIDFMSSLLYIAGLIFGKCGHTWKLCVCVCVYVPAQKTPCDDHHNTK